MNQNEKYLISLLSCALNNQKSSTPSSAVNIEEVYNIANRHHILHTVYEKLPEEIINQNDSEILKKWKENYLLNKTRDLRQLIAKDEITDILVKNGIRVMPLKGMLLKELYPVTYLRRMTDLDFLIDEENSQAVKKLLCSIGYKEETESEKHFSFSKNPGIYVEIHTRLFDKRFENVFTDVFDNAKKINGYLYDMSSEDLCLHTIIHYAEHYLSTGIGIRAILDLEILKINFPDVFSSKSFEKRLEHAGCYRFFTAIDDVSKIWFEDKKEDDKNIVIDYIFSSSTHGTENDWAVKYAGDLSSRKTKAGVLFGVVFPKYSDMCERFEILKKAPVLLPACYLVRITKIVAFSKKYNKLIRSVGKIDTKNIDRRKAVNEKFGFNNSDKEGD